MKSGAIIDVPTNYELLNRILGTSYKAWMSGIKQISDKCYIWMVSLDGKERSGWVNELHCDTITEKYMGGTPYPSNIDVGLNLNTRYVFDKINNNGKKYFIFRGVYKLCPCGTRLRRKLQKVSDEAF